MTRKRWVSIFPELLSWIFSVSITHCRKFLPLIPALFVCVDECEVTSDPDRTEWAEDTDNADLPVGKQHRCWFHFLFPASDLRKRPIHCFQLLGEEIRLSLKVRKHLWCLFNLTEMSHLHDGMRCEIRHSGVQMCSGHACNYPPYVQPDRRWSVGWSLGCNLGPNRLPGL